MKMRESWSRPKEVSRIQKAPTQGLTAQATKKGDQGTKKAGGTKEPDAERPKASAHKNQSTAKGKVIFKSCRTSGAKC